MEVLQSVVKVIKEKPPAEPPPSLEYNEDELDLYVTDVTSYAANELEETPIAKIAQLHGVQYTPFATTR